MSFLANVANARAVVQTHGRVSLRALTRELGLDADLVEEIVEELVDVQQVARRERNVLIWLGEALPTQTGGGSRGRTRLWEWIPARQGKYREILPNLTLLAEPDLSFQSVSTVIGTDFL